MISGVGPALVDRVCIIDKYPARGDQAIVKKVEKHAGGAAGNVMHGLSTFGIKTRFYSTIGNDDDGKFYIEEMKKAGVECILKEVDAETGKVDIYVDKSGERTFFVFPGAAGEFYPFLNEDHYKWGEYFYLDPFPFEGSLEAHIEIAKKAKKYGRKVILNPGHPYSKLGLEKIRGLLKYTDIVFLSSHEYKMLKGIEDCVKVTIITLGERGSMAIVGGKRYFAEAFKVKVVDSTGAGDAFAAGFIYAMLKGYSIDVCLKAGNFTASFNVQRIGARNFPKKEELDNFLKNYSNISRDVDASPSS